MKKTGCVHLVGAGCGDADLITLRGWNLLRACDVVIYDDLIAPELLEALPDQVEKRYMGKRSSCHSAPQAEICAALVDEARKGRRVVRLKGGDPFLFGRGGEEILALQAAGIPCEEVPGIPSAIAIPAEAGIPVTHRGVSRSVHIVTAHTADTADGLPEHLEALARTSGTLVFLMGLAQLPRIAQRLLGAGMDPQTPAAVLSGGNAPHPAEVRGTLADIVQRVQEAGVLPPAVIVVGAVAALHLTESEARPLSGRTIALTGTTAVTDKLRPALRALGAQVFAAERAKVRVLPLPSLPPVLNSGKPCWLVFTSANGVEVFFSHLCRWGVDLRRLHTCRFAVIGAATKAALWAHGIQADLCPDTLYQRGPCRLPDSAGAAGCGDPAASLPAGKSRVIPGAGQALLRAGHSPVRSGVGSGVHQGCRAAIGDGGLSGILQQQRRPAILGPLWAGSKGRGLRMHRQCHAVRADETVSGPGSAGP